MAGTSIVSSYDLSENLRITLETNLSESRLSELGVKSWAKLDWAPGKYLLKFDAEETCYLLKGTLKIGLIGSSESLVFGAGDLITIPRGLSCTWDVSLPIDSYYKLASP